MSELPMEISRRRVRKLLIAAAIEFFGLIPHSPGNPLILLS